MENIIFNALVRKPIFAFFIRIVEWLCQIVNVAKWGKQHYDIIKPYSARACLEVASVSLLGKRGPIIVTMRGA